MQKSPHKLQGLLIGVLVDLCDNPKVLLHKLHGTRAVTVFFQ